MEFSTQLPLVNTSSSSLIYFGIANIFRKTLYFYRLYSVQRNYTDRKKILISTVSLYSINLIVQKLCTFIGFIRYNETILIATRVTDLECFCDQYSFIVLTFNYLQLLIAQRTFLHQNKNREEGKNRKIVLVRRILNYYPNYPAHRLYFGEVETPYKYLAIFLDLFRNSKYFSKNLHL